MTLNRKYNYKTITKHFTRRTPLPVQRCRWRSEAAVSGGMDGCGAETLAGAYHDRDTVQQELLGSVGNRCVDARRHPRRHCR